MPSAYCTFPSCLTYWPMFAVEWSLWLEKIWSCLRPGQSLEAVFTWTKLVPQVWSEPIFVKGELSHCGSPCGSCRSLQLASHFTSRPDGLVGFRVPGDKKPEGQWSNAMRAETWAVCFWKMDENGGALRGNPSRSFSQKFKGAGCTAPFLNHEMETIGSLTLIIPLVSSAMVRDKGCIPHDNQLPLDLCVILKLCC